MRSLSILALFALLTPAQLLVAEEKLETTPYFPLAVGNTWHYKRGEQKQLTRVVRQEKIGDVSCAVLSTEVDGKADPETFIAVQKDGVYHYKGNGFVVEPPMALFTLPPKEGHSWKFDSKLGAFPMKGTSQMAEEKIEVPAGKFTAWKVTTEIDLGGAKITGTQFMVKDIGIVKVSTDVPGLPPMVVELEKFEKAK